MFPNDILKTKVAKANFSGELDLPQIASEMVGLMHNNGGLGLAAPQVGHNVAMFVMRIITGSGGELMVVNPSITSRYGVRVGTEGCLSIPGVELSIRRHKSITLEGFTPEGEPIKHRLSGVEAVIAQHEFDHLQGILIFDRVSYSARKKALEEYRRMREIDKMTFNDEV